MPKNVFDAVLASAPVDMAAVRVTSRGEHYDPKVHVDVHKHAGFLMHSDVPLRCIPIPEAARCNPTFVDLTGRTFGRMTVIGYLGRLRPDGKKKSFWLLRCACGNYEPRRQEKVKIGAADAACKKCLAWRDAKRRYEELGSCPIEKFTSR